MVSWSTLYKKDMKHRSVCINGYVFVLLCLLSSTFPCFSWTIKGKVVDVYDGDSLTIIEDETGWKRLIRLSAIDAPELSQSFGKESREFLYTFANEKQVTADCYRTIRQRIEICTVTLKDKDLALNQLEAGMAWRFRLYVEGVHPKKRYPYELAEKKAKLEQRGLWSEKNPIRPYKWREKFERWDWYWDWYYYQDW